MGIFAKALNNVDFHECTLYSKYNFLEKLGKRILHEIVSYVIYLNLKIIGLTKFHII